MEESWGYNEETSIFGRFSHNTNYINVDKEGMSIMFQVLCLMVKKSSCLWYLK